MSEEKKSKQLTMKARILILILCPLIVIACCSVAIVLTVSTIVDEKYDFSTEEAETFEAPEASEAPAALMTFISDVCEDTEIYVNRSVDVSLSDFDGNITDGQKSILGYLAGDISGKIGGFYDTENVDYGEEPECVNIGEFVPYVRESSAELNENGDRICYTLSLDTGSNPISDKYRKLDDSAAEQVAAGSTEACLIENIKADMTELTVYGESDKEGRMTYLYVERRYDVKADVVFRDDLDELGTQNLSLVYTVREKKSLTYAGISIKQDNISLEGNGFQTLGISANVSENCGPDDYRLTFTSSDESILKADQNGMIEAVSISDKPVTVTATLEYLGHTYTDTCTVYVCVPVEGISVKPRKSTVSVGETFFLEAKLDPKDATIKGIIWRSEDSTICNVNANGSITALRKGETRIIAISEDGHYMSAAEITVG